MPEVPHTEVVIHYLLPGINLLFEAGDAMRADNDLALLLVLDGILGSSHEVVRGFLHRITCTTMRNENLFPPIGWYLVIVKLLLVYQHQEHRTPPGKIDYEQHQWYNDCSQPARLHKEESMTSVYNCTL